VNSRARVTTDSGLTLGEAAGACWFGPSLGVRQLLW